MHCDQSESVATCWGLPDGSFGKAYADFMEQRGFQAGDRPPVRFVDDEELAYVATRYREVHDFWHVLFGCPTNIGGELALKAVEFVQVSTVDQKAHSLVSDKKDTQFAKAGMTIITQTAEESAHIDIFVAFCFTNLTPELTT